MCLCVCVQERQKAEEVFGGKKGEEKLKSIAKQSKTSATIHQSLLDDDSHFILSSTGSLQVLLSHTHLL